MTLNHEMLFERTMQSLLGKKASHIAGQVHSEKSRKQWYKKAITKVIKIINRTSRLEGLKNQPTTDIKTN